MFAFYHFYQLFAIVQYGKLPKLLQEPQTQSKGLTHETSNNLGDRKLLALITATLKFSAKRSTKGFVYGDSLRAYPSQLWG